MIKPTTLKEWLKLSTIEKKAALKAFLYMIVFPVWLKVLGYDGLKKMLDRRPAGRMTLEKRTVMKILERTAAHLSPGCLIRSLASFALLKSFGHPAELVIGVRRQNGKIDAHAWLKGEEAAEWTPLT